MSNSLHAAMVKIGNHFRNKMLERLSAGSYPGKGRDGWNARRNFMSIQDASYVSQVRSNEDTHSISVVIPLQRAPYALAYEFGSGIHAGSRKKYPITPKNVSVLKFPWLPSSPITAIMSDKNAMFDRVKQMYARKFEQGDDLKWMDTWYYHWVDHPGVVGQPYIEPTLVTEMDTMVEMAADAAIDFLPPSVTIEANIGL